MGMVFWCWFVGGVGGESRNKTEECLIFKITGCFRWLTSGSTNTITSWGCPPSIHCYPIMLRIHQHFPWLGAKSASQAQWRWGRWWGMKVGRRVLSRDWNRWWVQQCHPFWNAQWMSASVHLIFEWKSWPSVVIFRRDYWPAHHFLWQDLHKAALGKIF